MTTAHSGSGDLSRSLELLWQGRGVGSRGPRPGLTLDGVVAAAVDVADREGLDALSMRKVAADLGVGTMSLYRYVPGKGELLDLMLDYVNPPLDEPETVPDEDWRQGLERMAHGSWELYLSHPWLLQVNQTRPILGPRALAAFDYALANLDGLGLSGVEMVAVVVAVDHYVTGTARTYILQRQVAEVSSVSDEEFWGAQEPTLTEAMASGTYPQVAKLPGEAFTMSGEDALEFGLKPLLDGLESFVDAHAGVDR